MPATLKDIAERVGKSVTTVSRALNDFDDVSLETKALVLEVAEELEYRPNTLAQRLQKRRSDTLGFIIPTYGPRLSDPFFSEFIAGIGNKAALLSYDILVSTHAPDDDEVEVYRRMVEGGRVDGFVICRTRRNDSRIQYLLDQDVPFTAFGRVDGDNVFHFVDVDGTHGIRLATDHLVSLGHRTIACIAPNSDLTFSKWRVEGLRDGLASHGFSLSDDLLREGNLTQRGGYEQASDLLDLPNAPSAIVACNDLMAFGAISAAQERDLKIGKDIAITGFDDIPMSAYSHPPLTTVHQPVYQIGAMVCEMLIKLIRGDLIEEAQILIKPSLVVRQSSGSQITS